MSTADPALSGYYRLHARVYDATRWAFLFGRSDLDRGLPANFAPRRILEIGVGTGVNLERLGRRYPQAELVGIDVSSDMLERARKRLGDRADLIEGAYGEAALAGPFDLIVASYMLTMVPDHAVEAILDRAKQDLSSAGWLVVVDFLDTRFAWFRRWMGVNHVALHDRLTPMLKHRWPAGQVEIDNAYAIWWRWFRFRAQGG